MAEDATPRETTVNPSSAARAQAIPLARLPAWLPVLALLALTVAFWGQPSGVYGSLYAVAVLNFVLSTFASLVAAYLLAWTFVIRGHSGLLLLGCTCLITGASGFTISGQSTPNILVTTLNVNAALAALCNLVGAALLLWTRRQTRTRGFSVAAAYAAVLIAVDSAAVAITGGWLPPFFVQGSGGTHLRQTVLAATIAGYVVASVLLRLCSRRQPDRFTSWYAMALDLRAVGLAAAFGNVAVGGPLFWISRAGIYIGGVYLLVAGILALREARVWHSSLQDKLRESENRLKHLIDNLPGSAVYQYVREADGKPHFLFVSASIERLCGVTPAAILEDAMALTSLTLPEDLASIEQAEEASQRELTNFECDVRLLLPDGRLRWMHMVSHPRRLPDGRVVWDGVQTDITERKLAEEALRDSRAKLDAAFRSMTDAVFITDAGGAVQDFNDGFVTFNRLGSRQECLERWAELRNAFDFLLPNGEPVPRSGRPIARALRGDSVANAEYILRRSDTGESWAGAFSFSPLRDQGGAIAGAVVVSHDITARKASEVALRESRAKLDAALNSMSDAVFICDSSGRVVEFNAAFVTYTRYRGRDVCLRTPAEYQNIVEVLLPGGDPAPLDSWAVPRALRGESATNEIYTLRRKDTGERWFGAYSFAPLRDKAGAIVGCVVVARDITAAKTAEVRMQELLSRTTALAAELAEREAQLQTSKQRLEAALDAAHLGTWSHIIGATETDWDSRMRQLWGVAAEGPISVAGISEMVVPEDREAMQRAMQDRTLSEKSTAVEFRIQRSDGLRWLRSVGRGVRGASGRIETIAGVVIDITERKLADEKVLSLQAQLAQAQKMEAIGRLAGGVAHDFNNLLTVINGHAALAEFRLPPDDPTRRHLTEIAKAGERATALTAQLLAFIRKQVLQPRRFDLNQQLKSISSILRRMVGEDIQVELLPASEPCTVNADPHQIEQVLLNLAVNARDAMPMGGLLRLETAVIDGDWTDLGRLRSVRRAVLSVTDTGLGMDETTQLHIFEPFFTTKAVGKGTGLGLSTVQGIIDQSGGIIEVHSAVGQGTTFRIELPLAGAPEAAPAESADPSDMRGSETILVIEDQPEVLAFTADVLRNCGYQVHTAISGMQGLEIWQKAQDRFDLLITDVVMPGMSGATLVARVKELAPDARFLFISGHTDDVVVRHGVQTQDVAFLQKPFRPRELAAKVRMVLAQAPGKI